MHEYIFILVIYIFAISAVFAAFVIIPLVLKRFTTDEPVCPNCRYPIRDLPSNICPECGANIKNCNAYPHLRLATFLATARVLLAVFAVVAILMTALGLWTNDLLPKRLERVWIAILEEPLSGMYQSVQILGKQTYWKINPMASSPDHLTPEQFIITLVLNDGHETSLDVSPDISDDETVRAWFNSLFPNADEEPLVLEAQEITRLVDLRLDLSQLRINRTETLRHLQDGRVIFGKREFFGFTRNNSPWILRLTLAIVAIGIIAWAVVMLLQISRLINGPRQGTTSPGDKD